MIRSAVGSGQPDAQLVPVGDTYLRSGAPNQNQGTLPTLRVQSSGDNRALIRFDSAQLAALPGAVTATLTLTIADNGENWGSTGRPIALHRVTRAWTEQGATWNCAIDTNASNGSPDCSGISAWEMGKPQEPALHPWTETPTATALITTSLSGVVSFDISADVALFRSGAAPNYGWILKKVDEGATGRVEFRARETANPPRLSIFVDPDDCAPNPCQNGGTCTDGIASYTCACATGFAGTACETNIDECAPNPCQNGGTCIDGIASYTCVCATGFAGANCETTYQRDQLVPVGDTYLRSGAPDLNQGALPTLRLRASGDNGGLIRFDSAQLAALPGTVTATLTFTIADNGNNWGSTGRPIALHRVTREWTELGATWNCAIDTNTSNHSPDCSGASAWEMGNPLQPDLYPWVATPTATANITSAQTGVVSFDISGDVALFRSGAALNYGWILKKVDENATGRVEFHSRETANAPVLLISVVDDTGIDDCDDDPCQNGGTCVDDVAGYTCICGAGFAGATCATNIDDCAPNPCLNSGTCIDGVASYTCTCATGFTGTTCATNIDDCAGEPCENGGTCVDGIASYSCSCADGFTGSTCATNIDDCADDPCQNGGTCVDGVASYTCTCATGFTGATCATNIDDCAANPCLNGGTCADGVASYMCTCATGFTGATCAINIDDCAPNPCLNDGTCVDGVASYTCACATGYTGDTCATNIDDCAPNPCLNDGTCVDGVASYNCTCTTGYTGDTCAANIDDCAANPCQNGGTCVDGVASYTCTCATGFTGTTCATNIDDCAPNPCLNDGTCVDGVASYTCICADGFAGTTCGAPVCTPANCNDNSLCTIDSCDADNNCNHAPKCQLACNATTGDCSLTCSDRVVDFENNAWWRRAQPPQQPADPNPKSVSSPITEGPVTFSATGGATLFAATANYQPLNGRGLELRGGAAAALVITFGSPVTGVRLFAATQANFFPQPPQPVASIVNYRITPAPATGSDQFGVDIGGVNRSFVFAEPTQTVTVTIQSLPPNFTHRTFFDSFEFDYARCPEHNQCAPSPCLNGATCIDDVASATCNCAPGYTGQNCAIDINDCLPNPCKGGGLCTDGVNSFTCSCNPGYVLATDLLTCTDVDECLTANGGCDHICTNSIGSYACSCGDGYTLGADSHACGDVDECLTANGGCSQVCTNSVGGFACSCGDGYTLGSPLTCSTRSDYHPETLVYPIGDCFLSIEGNTRYGLFGAGLLVRAR